VTDLDPKNIHKMLDQAEKDNEYGTIAEALAKAQGQMTHAQLDKVNPHFKSKYASLQSVLTAVRKPLTTTF